MASSRFLVGAARSARATVFPRRTALTVLRNRYSTQPPTPTSTEGRNLHRTFYSSFGAPILKVFLGAVFTYQLLYWSWLKLESLELKKEKDDEVKGLEEQLRGLKGVKSATGQEKEEGRK